MLERSAYRFGDLTIACELTIPDLPRAAADDFDWMVSKESIATCGSELEPYHTWEDPEGLPVVRFGWSAGRRVIDFGHGARFTIDTRRRIIGCASFGGVDDATLAQLLAHEVLPLVAGLDRLVLHASAVSFGGGALVFAGASGSGKSTMAVRMAQRGCLLLSDDVVLIDGSNRQPSVLPMFTPIRLWPDAIHELVASHVTRADAEASAKRVLSVREAGIQHASDTVPLRALFLLGAASATNQLTVIEPRDAVAALLQQSFVLATDDADHATRMLEEVTRMVRAVRVWRVPTPDNFDDLDAILDTVLATTTT